MRMGRVDADTVVSGLQYIIIVMGVVRDYVVALIVMLPPSFSINIVGNP